MSKPDFDLLLSSGVDEVNRRIYFGHYLPNSTMEEGNSVDQVSIEYAVRALQKMAEDNNKRPIEIHMNSYGGDVYSAFYLIDVIEASPCQIKFIGGGAVMSAASFIMAVCDERILHKNATVMIHEIATAFEGKMSDLRVDTQESTRIQDKILDVYAANSRMAKDFWKDICGRDLHLSAVEAINLGLADKLIEPRKRGSFRKTRVTHLNQKISKKQMKGLIGGIYQKLQVAVIIKDVVLNGQVKEEIDPTLTIGTKQEENNGTTGKQSDTGSVS
jgi:ATP-dependent protease ClpP protease subunit